MSKLERMTIRSKENTNMVWMLSGEHKLEPCEMSNHDTGEVLRRLAMYEDKEESSIVKNASVKHLLVANTKIVIFVGIVVATIALFVLW